MKKKHIVILVIVMLVILLIPIPVGLKDGGTVEYNAILYSVIKQHSISDQGRGYDVGTRIRILFFEVYNDVEFVAEE